MSISKLFTVSRLGKKVSIFLCTFLPVVAFSQTFKTIILDQNIDNRSTQDTPREMAISPDSSKVAVGTKNGKVIVIDAKTGKTLSEWPVPVSVTGRDVLALTFSQDSKLLAVGSNQSITVSDADGSNARPPIHFADTPKFLKFSPKGHLLATSLKLKTTFTSEDNLNLCILDATDLLKGCNIDIKVFTSKNSKKSWDGGSFSEPLSWMPDGQAIVSLNRNNDNIKIFSAKDGKQLRRLPVPQNSNYRASTPFTVSSNGDEIIAFASGTKISRFSLETGELIKGPGVNLIGNESRSSPSKNIALMSNGKSVVLSSSNKSPLQIEIIDAESLVSEGYIHVRPPKNELVSLLTVSDSFDIYALLVRKVIGKGENGLEIYNHELQVWPMPKMKTKPMAAYQ